MKYRSDFNHAHRVVAINHPAATGEIFSPVIDVRGCEELTIIVTSGDILAGGVIAMHLTQGNTPAEAGDETLFSTLIAFADTESNVTKMGKIKLNKARQGFDTPSKPFIKIRLFTAIASALCSAICIATDISGHQPIITNAFVPVYDL